MEIKKSIKKIWGSTIVVLGVTFVLVTGCKKENSERLATITTGINQTKSGTFVQQAGVSTTVISVVGKVTHNGGAPVLEKGICFTFAHSHDPSLLLQPTIQDAKIKSSSLGDGDFTIPITLSQPGGTYGIRSYVITRAGVAYGDLLTHKTAALKESRGEKGDKGDTGAAGVKGDKGDTGVKGDTGATGVKGDKGDAGVKGDTGAAGVKGDKGDTGVKGDTGAAGVKGDAGAAGVKGDKGDAGANGVKGDKGDTGVKGDTGAAGVKGDKGDTGAAGVKGDKGDTGVKGDTGAAGVKGDTGAAGVKGDTGAAGVKGDTGAAGVKGDKGDRGEAGAPGVKGDKGDTGEAGAPGVKGDTGEAGKNGKNGKGVASGKMQAVSIGDHSITFEFEVTDDGGIPVSGIRLFYRNDGMVEWDKDIYVDVPRGSNKVTATVTQLSSKTAYNFRVDIINSAGKWSPEVIRLETK